MHKGLRHDDNDACVWIGVCSLWLWFLLTSPLASIADTLGPSLPNGCSCTWLTVHDSSVAVFHLHWDRRRL